MIKTKNFLLKRFLPLFIFSTLIIVAGISLFVYGHTPAIKRIGLVVGGTGFAIDMVSSLIFIMCWRRLWESQMLRGMLLQIFGLPSSLELPENWQNSLKGNSTKIEFKEIRGERLSSLDFLCKGIALCLEGNYTPAINAFENSAEREPYKVEAWVGKALLLTHLGYYESALDAIEKAVEISPNDEEIGKIREIIRSKRERKE